MTTRPSNNDGGGNLQLLRFVLQLWFSKTLQPKSMTAVKGVQVYHKCQYLMANNHGPTPKGGRLTMRNCNKCRS